MAPAAPPAYLRFPSISGNTVAFVTEDDLWTAPAEGGPAYRLTADLLGLARPVLSPDGQAVALTSDSQGPPEVYVVPAGGGVARRLTWAGSRSDSPMGLSPTKVLAWTPDGRVAFATDAGQPFSAITMAYAVGADGRQPPEPLPYGPVRDLAYGPGGGTVIGRNTADPATWKRYRGGRAGAIWLDREGDGGFQLLLRPDAVGGNLASPMWVGERIYFLSDHEGVGNLYSCSLAGDGIRRHTEHAEHYARQASSDGNRIVYMAAGSLWIFDPSTDRAEQIPVEVGTPRAQRRPRFVPAQEYLGHYDLNRSGDRVVADVRGKLFSFALFDRPVVQHGLAQGARYRLAAFVGDGSRIAAISDASGYEKVELHTGAGEDGDGSYSVRALEVPGLGRVIELAASPDGARLAVSDHQYQLFVISTGTGEHRLADRSDFGRLTGLSWSPDSRWLAYSCPASLRTSQIKLAEATGGAAVAVTEPQFQDSSPSFDPSGMYLYFLSRRVFDPVHDSLFHDLGFPLGSRPYLVTLQAGEPSPFVIRPKPGRPPGAGEARHSLAPGTADGHAGPTAPTPVPVDLEGISERVVELPVPEARYEGIVALEGKVLLLSRPLEGSLGHPWVSEQVAANGVLECYDLVEDRRETFLSDVVDFTVNSDRTLFAYTTGVPDGQKGKRMRVLSATAKPDDERAKEAPGPAVALSTWAACGCSSTLGPNGARCSVRRGACSPSTFGSRTSRASIGRRCSTVTCR
ncbi:MAG: S41 family peptidase [Acidimicrobiales bacterium]